MSDGRLYAWLHYILEAVLGAVQRVAFCVDGFENCDMVRPRNFPPLKHNTTIISVDENALHLKLGKLWSDLLGNADAWIEVNAMSYSHALQSVVFFRKVSGSDEKVCEMDFSAAAGVHGTNRFDHANLPFRQTSIILSVDLRSLHSLVRNGSGNIPARKISSASTVQLRTTSCCSSVIFEGMVPRSPG